MIPFSEFSGRLAALRGIGAPFFVGLFLRLASDDSCLDKKASISTERIADEAVVQ